MDFKDFDVPFANYNYLDVVWKVSGEWPSILPCTLKSGRPKNTTFFHDAVSRWRGFVHISIAQAFFTTPAAEKTKTQG